MARRAELFVRELSDEEAVHLLRRARRGKNAVVRHRAMLLFALLRGRSVAPFLPPDEYAGVRLESERSIHDLFMGSWDPAT
jgi:hypothetical protein